jgi:alkanesulfonate monooxygenase SsuD/methylene tetrahydromethanopterin reductase-like flavin-dependent oxidoreductase (luciferase family)
MSAMTFGTFHLYSLPPWLTERDVIQGELEQGIWAEELGFDDVWVAEHSARVYGIVGSAQVPLAALAARTNRVRIGTAVTRTPLHHPLHLAEDLACVDVLSDGRLVWGVGRGYDPLEFASYDVDFEERDERWDEGIEIVLKAWRDGRICHEGKHYVIPETELFPKPVQRPHPPVYLMVSRSNSSVEYAARRLWPVIFGQGPDWDDTKHKMELYRETAIQAGFEAERVSAVLGQCGQLKQVHVAPTTEQAREEYREGLMWYFQASANRTMFGFKREVQPYEYYLHHRNVMLGSPDALVETIGEFRAYTGVNNIMCWFNCGGPPREQVRRSMETFAARVMPQLRTQT